MLSRRTLLTGAIAAVGSATGRANAAPAQMRWANASGSPSSQLAYGTVGQHPRLNFYKQEGVDLEVLNMQGSAITMQAMLQGNCEFASISPISLLPLLANNPRLDVVVPFVWLRQIHTSVWVLPDSTYKNVADLRGKNIGFWNTSDTAYAMARQMMKELALDPDKDVEWTSVGLGLPAGKALHERKVDALAYADTEAVRLDMGGYSLRALPNVGSVANLFGLAWGVRRSQLARDRAAFVGLFRGMAKSTLFAHANPELATRLHFELYPEARPKGIDYEQAVKESQRVLEARKDKWFPAPGKTADPRIGGQTKEDWDAWLGFTGLRDKIKDVSAVFTNDILDEVNAFDHEAIRTLAREMKP